MDAMERFDLTVRVIIFVWVPTTFGFSILSLGALANSIEQTTPVPVSRSAQGTENLRDEHYAADLEEYQTASDIGDHAAQFQIGNIYFKGLGAAVDHKIAFEYYQKAAKGGNGSAEIALGDMYSDGDTVTADTPAAKSHYRNAIADGNSWCELRIAALEQSTADVKENIEALTNFCAVTIGPVALKVPGSKTVTV